MHMGGGFDLTPVGEGGDRQYVTSMPQLLHSVTLGASMSLPDRASPLARSCVATPAMCSCSAWAPAMILVVMTLTVVVRDAAIPPLPTR